MNTAALYVARFFAQLEYGDPTNGDRPYVLVTKTSARELSRAYATDHCMFLLFFGTATLVARRTRYQIKRRNEF